MLKQCDHPQLTNLQTSLCYSCTIENVIFINLGSSLIGSTYLTEIMMMSDRQFQMLCPKIELNYWKYLQSYNDDKHNLTINQVNITSDRSRCYSNGAVGLHISIAVNLANGLTITLTNSIFSNLDHTALTIIDRVYGYNQVHIENCTFENNYIRRASLLEEITDTTLRPLIEIVSTYNNKLISFKQCKIAGNRHANILISILMKNSKMYHVNCINPVTNITFVACQLIGNIVSELINVKATLCKSNLLIIGPTYVTNTTRSSYKSGNILFIYRMTVDIIGPVIMSFNSGNAIMFFDY